MCLVSGTKSRPTAAEIIVNSPVNNSATEVHSCQEHVWRLKPELSYAKRKEEKVNISL
jgi:hypothetical protein